MTATLTVVPGEILNVFVGGQGGAGAAGGLGGFNGGGAGGTGTSFFGGGGGGASDIRRGGIALSNRVVVAGGGGGGAFTGVGGAGGGTTGGAGTASPPNVTAAGGGTQSAGGAGGVNSVEHCQQWSARGFRHRRRGRTRRVRWGSRRRRRWRLLRRRRRRWRTQAIAGAPGLVAVDRRSRDPVRPASCTRKATALATARSPSPGRFWLTAVPAARSRCLSLYASLPRRGAI